jgi:hypothetical protein
MSLTHPNRTRGQSTGSEEIRRKQSGDQHEQFQGENQDGQHRPHRLNRDDMQKQDQEDTPE